MRFLFTENLKQSDIMSSHDVDMLDRLLRCTISPWLASYNAEDEGASVWEPDVEYSMTFGLWNLLAPNESEGSNKPMMDDHPKEDSLDNE